MIHPFIYDRNRSVWGDGRSVICTQAALAQAERDRAAAEIARRERKRHERLWTRLQGLQAHSRFNGARLEGIPASNRSIQSDSPRKADRQNKCGVEWRPASVTQRTKPLAIADILRVIREAGHPLTAAQVYAKLPDHPYGAMANLWPELVSAGKLLAKKGPNPDYIRHRLAHRRGGRTECRFYALPEWREVVIPEIQTALPMDALSPVQISIYALLTEHPKGLTRGAIHGKLTQKLRPSVDNALHCLLMTRHIIAKPSPENRSRFTYFHNPNPGSSADRHKPVPRCRSLTKGARVRA